jgi:thymidine phosphorylase
MDVKVGSGAFMETYEKALELAQSVLRTAAIADLRTHALITDMNEVLGTTVGNAVEIAESMQFLRNEVRDERLNEVVLALCAEMLVAGGLEPDRAAAVRQCEDALTSGRAAEIFGQMCAAMGGPDGFVDDYSKHLPRAPVTRPVFADGYLAAVNARSIGSAIIELGGGRTKVGQKLDLAVGLSGVARIGTRLDRDTPLAIVHAASDDDAKRAEVNVLAACRIEQDRPESRPVVLEILTG